MVNAVEVLWPAEAELGEGTCWSVREQALWWVDILGRQLHRWRAGSGQRSSWAFEQEISAVAECAEGPGLVVALRQGLAHFDPAHPAPLRWLHRPPEEPPGNRFNDGKCDPQGRFWAGSMDFDCVAPTGALYSLEPGVRCVRHPLGWAVTNGPAFSADGRTMWANDTTRGTVHAFDFDPATGAIANGRPWLQLAEGDGLPDGMSTDADGVLWLCHWGGSCVTAHDPASARELARIELPASQITNCAFGGPDFRTLFITSARVGLGAAQLAREPLAGALFAVALDRPGRAAPLFGAAAGVSVP